MGSGTNTAIAIPLAVVGTAALVGLLVGSLGLLRARAWIGPTASVLAVGLSAVLGLVALVFVFSLRWFQAVDSPFFIPGLSYSSA
jgi:hypothetical protein